MARGQGAGGKEREPFKETFLCLERRGVEGREETWKYTTKWAGRLAGLEGSVVRGGWRWLLGHTGIRPSIWGSTAAPRSKSLRGLSTSGKQGRDLESGRLGPHSFHFLRMVPGERPSPVSEDTCLFLPLPQNVFVTPLTSAIPVQNGE